MFPEQAADCCALRSADVPTGPTAKLAARYTPGGGERWRVGIFGGTFDPVHYGHLIVAEQAREQARLDQVWFVPSARPPHKADRVVTPFDRRAEMLALALAGHEDKFRVETIEKDRPGPSYTADTLDALARSHPEHRVVPDPGGRLRPRPARLARAAADH